MRTHHQVQMISAEALQALIHRPEDQLLVVLIAIDAAAIFFLEDGGHGSVVEFALLTIKITDEVVRLTRFALFDVIERLSTKSLLLNARKTLVDRLEQR